METRITVRCPTSVHCWEGWSIFLHQMFWVIITTVSVRKNFVYVVRPGVPCKKKLRLGGSTSNRRDSCYNFVKKYMSKKKRKLGWILTHLPSSGKLLRPAQTSFIFLRFPPQGPVADLVNVNSELSSKHATKITQLITAYHLKGVLMKHRNKNQEIVVCTSSKFSSLTVNIIM